MESEAASEAADDLGSQLAKLSCIQQIHLCCNGICAFGIASLAPHLTHLTSIQKLDLSCNTIDPNGFKSLGPHLAPVSYTHLTLPTTPYV